jgi:hypothetical protein
MAWSPLTDVADPPLRLHTEPRDLLTALVRATLRETDPADVAFLAGLRWAVADGRLSWTVPHVFAASATLSYFPATREWTWLAVKVALANAKWETEPNAALLQAAQHYMYADAKPDAASFRGVPALRRLHFYFCTLASYIKALMGTLKIQDHR